MGETVKIAVNPPIHVGGSLFTPAQLAKIGVLAGEEAKIEMTPFKQLYIEVPLERSGRITEELRQAGLEVNPSGFVIKSLIACNFCKGAEEAGLETARKVNEAIAGIETPAPLKIGFAGCALGTSEPLLKDIGIVKMKDVFDIYVGGEPKGLKASVAKRLLFGVTNDRLVSAIIAIIDYYKANAKGKEKFSKFVDRVTLEELQQKLTKRFIQIYTIPTCSDCNHAKRYFKEQQISYTEYNCEEDASYAEEVRKLTGKQIVPTIVMDGKVFIGFADNFTEINELLQG